LYCQKIKIKFQYKKQPIWLVSTRRSIVLILPLEWGFPGPNFWEVVVLQKRREGEWRGRGGRDKSVPFRFSADCKNIRVHSRRPKKNGRGRVSESNQMKIFQTLVFCGKSKTSFDGQKLAATTAFGESIRRIEKAS
jgi:hypothetical protein